MARLSPGAVRKIHTKPKAEKTKPLTPRSKPRAMNKSLSASMQVENPRDRRTLRPVAPYGINAIKRATEKSPPDRLRELGRLNFLTTLAPAVLDRIGLTP